MKRKDECSYSRVIAVKTDCEGLLRTISVQKGCMRVGGRETMRAWAAAI